MKAAGSREQLADRMKRFERLSLKPVIELHLAGLDDIYANNKRIAELCGEHDCEYMVHFPVKDMKTKYLFDAYNNEDTNVQSALDFCKMVNSSILIMHRCFGFNRGLAKGDAEEMFLDKLKRWDAMAREKKIRILFENYGFIWLPEAFEREFVTSPLDHFFPWDIKDFNDRAVKMNMNNIGVLLDVAHATLSSNMFNMLKKFPALESDRRFANIYDADLEKKDILKPEDFVLDCVNYFHISDAFAWSAKDGINDLSKYLYTEGLPIGKGNIDYREIFGRITGNGVMVMEIEPENGDYANNVSQQQGIELIREYA